MSEERVIRKLDELQGDMGDIKTKFAVQETKLDRVIIDLDKVKVIVEGNGLAKKVSILESWKGNIEKFGRWALAIVGTVIGGAILIVLGIVIRNYFV